MAASASESVTCRSGSEGRDRLTDTRPRDARNLEKIQEANMKEYRATLGGLPLGCLPTSEGVTVGTTFRVRVALPVA